tara:strand:- start:1606 stop:1737 length:132 start_codon:yes stop_codon:yes gene_type:complete
LQNNFANPEQKKFYYIKRMMKMVNIGAAVVLGVYLIKNYLGGW